MTGHAVAGFLAVTAVVIATPGPDTALTVRNTLRGGRRAGTVTAAGVAVGQLVWAVASAVGVAAALAASATAFRVVQCAGAGYLLMLAAASAWHAARRRVPRPDASIDAGSRTRSSARIASDAWPGRALRQGVLSNLANPKMAAFFTALLPPFTTHADHPLATMLALGVTFAALTLAWLCAYAAFAARAAPVLARDAVRRAMDAVCAVAFLVLGARVATEVAPA